MAVSSYWLIIFAAIFYGTITVGSQFFTDLGLSAYEISVFQVGMISLTLLPFVLSHREYFPRKESWPFFLVYGLIGAFTHFTQYGSVVLGVPVAVVAFLLYSQPLWTTLLGRLVFKETVTVTKLTAAVIATAGVAILVKPWDSVGAGPVLGVIFGLLGGLGLSLWIIFGRKGGLDKQHFTTATFGYTGFSAIWLLLLLLPVTGLMPEQANLTRLSFHWPLTTWILLFFYALISGVIPHALFYKGIRKVQSSTAGILLLLEPVSATLLAAAIFRQPIGLNILFGGLLILLANGLILRDNRSRN